MNFTLSGPFNMASSGENTILFIWSAGSLGVLFCARELFNGKENTEIVPQLLV